MASFLSSVGSAAGSTLKGLGSGVVSGLTGGAVSNLFSPTDLGVPKVKNPVTGVVGPQNAWFNVAEQIGKVAGSSTDIGRMSTSMSQLAGGSTQKPPMASSEFDRLMELAKRLSAEKDRKKREPGL